MRRYMMALALVFAATSTGAVADPYPPPSYPTVYPITFQCGTGWDLTYCPTGVPIRAARLYVQLSNQPCVLGESWGWNDAGDLWVSQGCRGSFLVYAW